MYSDPGNVTLVIVQLPLISTWELLSNFADGLVLGALVLQANKRRGSVNNNRNFLIIFNLSLNKFKSFNL